MSELQGTPIPGHANRPSFLTNEVLLTFPGNSVIDSYKTPRRDDVTVSLHIISQRCKTLRRLDSSPGTHRMDVLKRAQEADGGRKNRLFPVADVHLDVAAGVQRRILPVVDSTESQTCTTSLKPQTDGFVLMSFPMEEVVSCQCLVPAVARRGWCLAIMGGR